MMNSNSPSPAPPDIVIQIVHIEGPQKGEIVEVREFPIVIGRDPSSHVAFPKDLRIISRRHAEIHREGNRFHLVNRSPNGCFVNGQAVEETYLKQGDVIAFAQGGPKVSFLYSMQPAARHRPSAPSPGPAASAPPPAPPRAPERKAAPTAPPESAPFTIQFGTSIKSFKQPSVRIGRDEASDFPLGDPRVFGSHAEVFYRQGQYYVRDLTQSQATLLNGRGITTETPLQENDVLGLSEGGPKLRYLGTGRLAEVIEAPAEEQRPAAPLKPPPAEEVTREESSLADRVRSLFRK